MENESRENFSCPVSLQTRRERERGKNYLSLVKTSFTFSFIFIHFLHSVHTMRVNHLNTSLHTLSLSLVLNFWARWVRCSWDGNKRGEQTFFDAFIVYTPFAKIFWISVQHTSPIWILNLYSLRTNDSVCGHVSAITSATLPDESFLGILNEYP